MNPQMSTTGEPQPPQPPQVLSGTSGNATSSVGHKERSAWTKKPTSDSSSAIAECPGCIAQHGTPHRCGIADENNVTSIPSPVDHQPNANYSSTTSTWHHQQAPNVVTHQPPGGITYATPPPGHLYVYAESQSPHLHDHYRMTTAVPAGYGPVGYGASGVPAPFYGGGPVEMAPSTRCSCGDPTCNQFVIVDVVGSTRVHQAAAQSNVFNGRNVYGVVPQPPPSQQHGYAYQQHYPHQVVQQQQHQQQHTPIGPGGFTNLHPVVATHHHHRVPSATMSWPISGNYVAAMNPMPQTVSVDNVGQHGGQHGLAHNGLPQLMRQTSADSHAVVTGGSPVQAEAHRVHESPSTMVELRSETLESFNAIQTDTRRTDSSLGQTQWRQSANGGENENYSDRFVNGVSRDVISTSPTVGHSSVAAGDTTNGYSTALTTAISSTSSSITSRSSPHASIPVASNTSNTGSNVTSTPDKNNVNVAEKDSGPTASTDDATTSGAGGDTNRRHSTHHGSMTFVVDLGNNNGPGKEVDEKAAAAKLEWLQRRSSQRSRSIERGDRNGSSDDVTQDSQTPVRRVKASISTLRRRTVEITAATLSTQQPMVGRPVPFTSPQMMPRSGRIKAAMQPKGYSSDEDDENNNKFGSARENFAAIFDKKKQNRSLIDKPPSGTGTGTGNSSVTGSRNQPMVALRNDRILTNTGDGEVSDVRVPPRGATSGYSPRDNLYNSKSYTSLNSRVENNEDETGSVNNTSMAENGVLGRQRRKRQNAPTGSSTDLVQQMLFSNQLGKAKEDYPPTTSDRRGDRKQKVADEDRVVPAPVMTDRELRASSDNEDAASDASGGTFVIGESDDEERAAYRDDEKVDKRLPECFTASSERTSQDDNIRGTGSKQADIDERPSTRKRGGENNEVDNSIDCLTNGFRRLGFVDDTPTDASQRIESAVGKTTTTTKPESIGNKISKLLFDAPAVATPSDESPKEPTVESRYRNDTTSDRKRPEVASGDGESRVPVDKFANSAPDVAKPATAFSRVRSSASRENTKQSSSTKIQQNEPDGEVGTDDVILFIHESSEDEDTGDTSKRRTGSKLESSRAAPSPIGSSKRHLPVVPPNNDERELSTKPAIDEPADNGRVIDVDFVAPVARQMTSFSSSSTNFKSKMQQLVNTKLAPESSPAGNRRLRVDDQPADDVTTTTTAKTSTVRSESHRVDNDSSPLLNLATSGAKVCRTVIVQSSTQLGATPAAERFVPISPSSVDGHRRQLRSSSTSSTGSTYADHPRKPSSYTPESGSKMTGNGSRTTPATSSRTTPGRSMPRAQQPLVSPTKDQRFFGGTGRTSAAKTPSSGGVGDVERPGRGGSVSPIKAVQLTTREKTNGGLGIQNATTTKTRDTRTSTTSGSQRMNSKSDNNGATLAETKQAGNRNRSISRTRTDEIPPARLSRRVNSATGNTVDTPQKTSGVTQGSRSNRAPSAGVQLTNDRGRTTARPRPDVNSSSRDVINGGGTNFRRSTSVGILSNTRRGSSQSPVRTPVDQEKLQLARDQFQRRMKYDPSRSAAIARVQTIRRRVEAGSSGSAAAGGAGIGSSEDDLRLAGGGSGGSIDQLSRNGSLSCSNRNSTGSVASSDEELLNSVQYRRRDRSSGGGGTFRNSGGTFQEAVAKLSASVAGDINALSRADLAENQRASEDDLVTTPFYRIQLRLILQLSQKVNQSAAILQQQLRSTGTDDSSIEDSVQTSNSSRQSSKTNIKLEEILHNLSVADRKLDACIESRSSPKHRSSNHRGHKDT